MTIRMTWPMYLHGEAEVRRLVHLPRTETELDAATAACP